MLSSKPELVASLSGPALTALLDAAGVRLTVGGNTPFLLDDPETAWWHERGRIELFLVELEDGQPKGPRRHFASLAPGTLLFGPDGSARSPTGFGLLAVPHVSTEVCRLPLACLRELSQDSTAAAELAAPIDAWIGALSEGLARWITPRPTIQQSLSPNRMLTMPAHSRASAAAGVVWAALPPHAAHYLDTQELPAGDGDCLFPLTAASWLHGNAELTLRTADSRAVIAAGQLWSGLDALHSVLFPTAELNLRLANVDEYNRLRSRVESVGRDWKRGLASLQSVLEDGPLPATLTADTDPLVTTLRAIGRHEGFEVRLPPHRRRADADEHPTLEALAWASGLRQRKVTLDAGWQHKDGNALLGFAADDGRPLAVLPNGRRGIKVLDPKHGKELAGDAALALLAPQAVAFTAPLPFRALNWMDLPRFAFKRTWRDLLTLVLSATAAGILGMALPIATAYLIDSVIPAHDRSQLLQLGVILAILGFTSFVMSYVGGIAFSRFESRAGPALQAAIVDRLLRLPVGFFRDYSAGDLALRASAVTHIQQLVSGTAAAAVMGGVFSVFSFGLLLYYDWRMGLWAVLITFVYAGATLTLTLLRLARERPLARLGGELQSMLLQFVGGIAKIRLAASEDRAFARWAVRFSAAERLRASATGFGNLQAALNSLFGLAALFFFFLILGNFGDGVADSALAVGGFAAFLSAFNNFNGSVTQMTQTLTNLLAVQPLLERAMPILKAAPEIRGGKADPGLLSGALEIAHVSFRYERSGPLVLDDISISVRAGEFIALVGASGCGKSTLLRLLLGFDVPEAGGILIDGQDMRELDLLATRRQIGVVLQNSRPLPGSLFDNIVGISGGSLDDAWDAARKVGLAQDIERMPMGMHTVVTEGSGSLSGGQLQRLMIARAIVGRPRILILDEATSALDNRTQAVVTESLDRLSVTRVVVAHRLSTIANANRIFVLDAGRVVETGSFDELMRANGHFARLAAAQIV